jgi:hypothetical protein
MAPNTESQWDQDMKLWEEATTFDDLIKLNIGYIGGQLGNTPYYVGRFDEVPLRDQLLNLHNLGILTFSVEPYAHFIYGVEDKEGAIEEVQQKPRISFVAPEKFGMPELVQSLQKIEDIDVLAERLYPFETITTLQEATICQYRRASSETQLESADWLTHAAMYLYDNAEEDFFALAPLKGCSPWVVHVAARNWARDTNVCDLIEEAIRGLQDQKLWKGTVKGI